MTPERDDQRSSGTQEGGPGSNETSELTHPRTNAESAPLVIDLSEVDRSRVELVGGKAAHLGELSHVDAIDVPPGFCVTTEAFAVTVATIPTVRDQLERLATIDETDDDAIRLASSEMRRIIESLAIPDEIATAIADEVKNRPGTAYAVRSSATAEDLPTASFAGQQDTYLNVAGLDDILRHVVLCWASLFTDRAVSYRIRNGFDHATVSMAVIVQQMVAADAAGVVFTADPISSDRKVVMVEAVPGLGEALVSGKVNGDLWRIRNGEIVDRAIATKKSTQLVQPGGGTREMPVEQRQDEPALTDSQILQLAGLARRIEEYFGHPQDIEWCLSEGGFVFVQSRPITTLFPAPAVDDGANHVYISVGHQQMMTDAMRPLGLSFWLLTTTAPMYEAGGRLFVDVTASLSSPTARAGLLDLAFRSDPLIRDALETVLDRGDFVPTLPGEGVPPAPAGNPPQPIANDPTIVAGLIEHTETSNATLESDIQGKTGEDLFDFILDDIGELRRLLFDPLSHQAIMAGIGATWWLNDNLGEWLGEKNPADTLTLSAPNNVTSEMGLALLDVADVIRPHRAVVDYLERVDDDGFLEELSSLEGGRQSHDAIVAYLEKYGVRCIGEIDITRPRWAERPSALIPLILGNIRNFQPGEARRRFEAGQRAAADKEKELLGRLLDLPDGEEKAKETKHMIDRVRTFIGYREYPKYGWVTRYFIYRQALLDEARRMVETGVITDIEDVYYLTFQELHELARTHEFDYPLVKRRKADFERFQTLKPPRVLTSDGEALGGEYRREGVPAGALVGLAVSSGTVEGIARIVLEMSEADLSPDDILVTTSTDPSWSPVFVAIKGLVTEVGGLMTHGAVVAREYGLPAVVGVADATRTIRDGQRIRVNGTDGYVEVLGESTE